MRHDCTSIVVARKAAPDTRPGVCQGLAAHVLDPLGEVALMPLLAVPVSRHTTPDKVQGAATP